MYTLTQYGVPEDNILGIRYGLRGFYERDNKPVTLTHKYVDGIHLQGGTLLVGAMKGCERTRDGRLKGDRYWFMGHGARAWGRPRSCLRSVLLYSGSVLGPVVL